MKIVIHTQYYPPEAGAPQTRLHELALGLMRNGIDVTVLTAMPSYPHGRIYEGYKGWLKVEYLDGVKIIRTAIYPTQSASMLRRMFNYFSFVFTSLLIGSWKTGGADFVLTESPPLFLGMAGFILSRWKKARWIFNLSDLWPESAVELGVISRKGLSYKISSVLERYLYKQAWLVTGQSKTIIENIHTRFLDLRTYHLPNGVDVNYFQPGNVQSANENLNIVYAGLHGLAQGLDQILMAAQKLSSEGCIDFIFVGDGPEKKKLIQLAKDMGLTNFHFLDSVSKDKLVQILKSADILMVPLKIQLTGAVPSKLYEAMSMGKPVILIAGSEAEKIVNAANCGLVVHPGDIDQLVSAIIHLKTHSEERKQMGANGRQAAIRNYDRADIVDKFAHFLLGEHEINLQ
jgi:glycosyltransferase involved in cell wall biosynthesis